MQTTPPTATNPRRTIEAEGMTLTFQQLSYGKITLEELRAGAEPIGGLATQDGRGMEPGWHEGEADQDDWVYYERYEQDGRVAHGWVHRDTRQLLQAG